jgi:sporulation protein YlmC with PRC-barrel domain
MTINKLLAASSIAALALTGSAVAQTPSTSQQGQPAAGQPAAGQPAAGQPAGATEKMDLKGTWRASRMDGLDIYNRNNERLGEVNDILLDKQGQVKAVVIGVGGFLGVGEHDIAVSMDKLQFMEEPRESAQADATGDKADTKGDKGATTGSATARQDATSDWAPDHAVMDATKEQLEAMPQFRYSDHD